MDINRAKEIVSALAEGIDPTTGELLDNDNVCNKGEVVRAFYAILEAIDKKPKKKLPENAGKRWTDEDEDLLKQLYQNGTSKVEICKRLKRSVTGIAARLVHLGVIDNRDIFRDRK